MNKGHEEKATEALDKLTDGSSTILSNNITIGQYQVNSTEWPEDMPYEGIVASTDLWAFEYEKQVLSDKFDEISDKQAFIQQYDDAISKWR